METAKNKWCYKNPHAVCAVAFTSQSAVKVHIIKVPMFAMQEMPTVTPSYS